MPGARDDTEAGQFDPGQSDQGAGAPPGLTMLPIPGGGRVISWQEPNPNYDATQPDLMAAYRVPQFITKTQYVTDPGQDFQNVHTTERVIDPAQIAVEQLRAQNAVEIEKLRAAEQAARTSAEKDYWNQQIEQKQAELAQRTGELTGSIGGQPTLAAQKQQFDIFKQLADLAANPRNFMQNFYMHRGFQPPANAGQFGTGAGLGGYDLPRFLGPPGRVQGGPFQGDTAGGATAGGGTASTDQGALPPTAGPSQLASPGQIAQETGIKLSGPGANAPTATAGPPVAGLTAMPSTGQGIADLSKMGIHDFAGVPTSQAENPNPGQPFALTPEQSAQQSAAYKQEQIAAMPVRGDPGSVQYGSDLARQQQIAGTGNFEGFTNKVAEFARGGRLGYPTPRFMHPAKAGAMRSSGVDSVASTPDDQSGRSALSPFMYGSAVGYAKGGITHEPIMGVGASSNPAIFHALSHAPGHKYLIGEKGPEGVVPASYLPKFLQTRHGKAIAGGDLASSDAMYGTNVGGMSTTYGDGGMVGPPEGASGGDLMAMFAQGGPLGMPNRQMQAAMRTPLRGSTMDGGAMGVGTDITAMADGGEIGMPSDENPYASQDQSQSPYAQLSASGDVPPFLQRALGQSRGDQGVGTNVPQKAYLPPNVPLESGLGYDQMSPSEQQAYLSYASSYGIDPNDLMAQIRQQTAPARRRQRFGFEEQ